MRYLLALLAVAALAPADEIRMKDGRVINGEVVAQSDESRVLVRTRIGGMSATLHLKAAEVAEIRFGKTEFQQQQEDFTTRVAALTAADDEQAQSADAWWRLAEEAKALDENVIFRDLAQRAIERDPAHLAARQALGYIKQDGEWMKPSDAAIARGEVYFRGRWMPPAQRDGILADEEREKVASEERAANERERRLAQIEIAKREAELRTARRAAERQPTYGSYSYGSYWPQTYGGSGWAWGIGRSPCAPVIVRPPVVVRPPLCHPSGGLQVQASGQGNGYAWSLKYR